MVVGIDRFGVDGTEPLAGVGRLGSTNDSVRTAMGDGEPGEVVEVVEVDGAAAVPPLRPLEHPIATSTSNTTARRAIIPESVPGHDLEVPTPGPQADQEETAFHTQLTCEPS